MPAIIAGSYVGARDQMGPHPCAAHNLLTGLSPQPLAVSSSSSNERRSHFTVQAGQELTVLLP